MAKNKGAKEGDEALREELKAGDIHPWNLPKT